MGGYAGEIVLSLVLAALMVVIVGLVLTLLRNK